MALIRPLPNLISAGRIVLAVAFPFVAEELRLPLVVAAGVSDGLDGIIARRFEATSWQGGLLDAAADKLFTASALFTLWSAGLLEPLQLALLMTRDVVVAGACLVVALRRRFEDFQRMQSRFAGKATTLLVFGLMGVLLLDLSELRMAFLGLSIAASCAAAVDYAQSFLSTPEDRA
jgi:phosphatidylglycerophosphate synthase